MFIPHKISPVTKQVHGNHTIHYFEHSDQNIDAATVESFGDEWEKFNFFSKDEIDEIAGKHYFDIVPNEYLKNKTVLDVGCGSGRWSKYAAGFAHSVDAVDPSKAIISAARLLNENKNVRLSCTSVDNLPFEDESFDFVFSLGVLHHIPDTQLAMKKCISKLKRGGHFLVYLYYDLDNKGPLFKALFKASDKLRRIISRLPTRRKTIMCDVIAVTVYMPIVLAVKLLKSLGMKNLAKNMPLHFYSDKSFNVIRNDALDRFGTPLEQRFTKQQIILMMESSGLEDITFSTNEPYWHAIGKKK